MLETEQYVFISKWQHFRKLYGDYGFGNFGNIVLFWKVINLMLNTAFCHFVMSLFSKIAKMEEYGDINEMWNVFWRTWLKNRGYGRIKEEQTNWRILSLLHLILRSARNSNLFRYERQSYTFSNLKNPVKGLFRSSYNI